MSTMLPSELLCAPNTDSSALTGIPRVYEQGGAVWLEFTGGCVDPPWTTLVSAIHIYADLALLTLDDGAMVIMRRHDLGLADLPRIAMDLAHRARV